MKAKFWTPFVLTKQTVLFKISITLDKLNIDSFYAVLGQISRFRKIGMPKQKSSEVVYTVHASINLGRVFKLPSFLMS